MVSSSSTLRSSTYSMRSVPMYANATAPFRKCMSGVAGTPVTDSPNASRARVLPSLVTSTITARRLCSAIASRTIRVTAGSDGESGVRAGSCGLAVHEASNATARSGERAVVIQRILAGVRERAGITAPTRGFFEGVTSRDYRRGSAGSSRRSGLSRDSGDGSQRTTKPR